MQPEAVQATALAAEALVEAILALVAVLAITVLLQVEAQVLVRMAGQM
jgi:hypothetical protein